MKTQGIGFFGLLMIVLIILKLCGVISCSWFWVLFPLSFTLMLILVFLSFALLGFVSVYVVKFVRFLRS